MNMPDSLLQQAPELLQGIRVYDASMGVAGPHCASLLALAGADVIKVEPPQGDWSRGMGMNRDGHSAYFNAFNRGKRSVALDLKQPEGREVALQLMQGCDLVLESFRPGVMKRLGLDYATISAMQPGMVYASVSGFGAEGPLAGRPALDTVIQAFVGWLNLNKAGDGTPVLMQHVAIDVLTGLYAFQACLLGLIGKFRFNRGRQIDVTLLGAAAAFLSPKIIEHVLCGGEPQSNIDVPMGIWRTRDGFVAIAVKDQNEFNRLCAAIEAPALAQDPRFCTRALRQQNGAALSGVLAGLLLPRSAAELELLLADAQVAAAKVRDFAGFLADPHVAAAQLVTPGCPQEGRMPFVNIPGFRSPATLPDAPAVGEHADAVLDEIGIGADQRNRLRAQGVLG